MPELSEEVWRAIRRAKEAVPRPSELQDDGTELGALAAHVEERLQAWSDYTLQVIGQLLDDELLRAQLRRRP